MFDAEAEEDAYYYIADVVERMLEAAGSLKSVHMALVIGERDFKKAGVSAWVRARVGRTEIFEGVSGGCIPIRRPVLTELLPPLLGAGSFPSFDAAGRLCFWPSTTKSCV